ncbi:hypothetical protein [Streptomyces sp. ISL-100]|uniref:hypothetical protein n=1 Tax=Streptomyces sp. ISL-100 TaxID=2819173 RepID=UPI001BE589B8|nr:hypothetical protein [Streptomyces sp. ISL-100]MBT2400675.1 hypothetical protein [Streptomyces sp. ISL-100]
MFHLGSRRMRRGAVIVGATVTASVVLAGQAFAWGGDWNGAGGGGGGTITFHSSKKATIDFTIVDTQKDGW